MLPGRYTTDESGVESGTRTRNVTATSFGSAVCDTSFEGADSLSAPSTAVTR